MILKGSQRGGARQLARHLLNTIDNDHVEVRSVEGFVGQDLTSALTKMYAVSRGTRCRQFMFSLSLSPPKGETVTVKDFEAAVGLAAEKLGLSGQPRVVVFHEKQGRRHCHVVFSRIDSEAMKAVNLPFYKQRLTELSRELYLTHGFDLPKGLADKSLANPLNFGLTEWGEAKNAKRDPREIKAALKQCWDRSDTGAAFKAALKDRGFWLCRGDRRGFVVIDYRNNVYSLSRWLDLKAKDLKLRLGEPERHPSIEEAKAEVTNTLSTSAQRLLGEIETRHAAAMKPLLEQKERMVERQRLERSELERVQKKRQAVETIARAQRFRKGIAGVWDWITGKRREVQRNAEAEIEKAILRDDSERQRQIECHLHERQLLAANIERVSSTTITADGLPRTSREIYNYISLQDNTLRRYIVESVNTIDLSHDQ